MIEEKMKGQYKWKDLLCLNYRGIEERIWWIFLCVQNICYLMEQLAILGCFIYFGLENILYLYIENYYMKNLLQQSKLLYFINFL